MKKFSIILFLAAFLFCNLNAQNSDIIPSYLKVKEGVIVSIEDIDVSILQIDLSEFHNKFIAKITLDHILCVAVDECEFDLAIELMNKGAKSTSKC
ncbi:hypothetical protein N9B82_05935 [Saprospiraceae bacterium]|nr:hypothetical protein [Saprospiraceae bacterium]